MMSHSRSAPTTVNSLGPFIVRRRSGRPPSRRSSRRARRATGQPAHVARVELLHRGRVLGVVGRPRLLVTEDRRLDSGSACQQRDRAAGERVGVAGESAATTESRPGGWSSAWSIASMPPQDWPIT